MSSRRRSSAWTRASTTPSSELRARSEEADDPVEDTAGDWEDKDDDSGGDDPAAFDDPEADEDDDE